MAGSKKNTEAGIYGSFCKPSKADSGDEVIIETSLDTSGKSDVTESHEISYRPSSRKYRKERHRFIRPLTEQEHFMISRSRSFDMKMTVTRILP